MPRLHSVVGVHHMLDGCNCTMHAHCATTSSQVPNPHIHSCPRAVTADCSSSSSKVQGAPCYLVALTKCAQLAVPP